MRQGNRDEDNVPVAEIERGIARCSFMYTYNLSLFWSYSHDDL